MTDKLYLAKQVAKMVAEADCESKGGSVSEHFGMVLLNRVNELETALRTTNYELLGLLNECNEHRQRDIRCDQLDPPELHDYQTCHDNAVLLGDTAND